MNKQKLTNDLSVDEITKNLTSQVCSFSIEHIQAALQILSRYRNSQGNSTITAYDLSRAIEHINTASGQLSGFLEIQREVERFKNYLEDAARKK